MASMGGGPHLDPEPLIRLVRGQGMLNKYLAAICKQEGLPSGGVKADLQNRIIESMMSIVPAVYFDSNSSQHYYLT
jgi:hypothetical protein